MKTYWELSAVGPWAGGEQHPSLFCLWRGVCILVHLALCLCADGDQRSEVSFSVVSHLFIYLFWGSVFHSHRVFFFYFFSNQDLFFWNSSSTQVIPACVKLTKLTGRLADPGAQWGIEWTTAGQWAIGICPTQLPQCWRYKYAPRFFFKHMSTGHEIYIYPYIASTALPEPFSWPQEFTFGRYCQMPLMRKKMPSIREPWQSE